ncbi:helix-turn-helix transcriptional regulator [Streptomyces sp. NPDC048611]|uniref:helix-turn-helix transcriptional regulator n=1 Tax=Streptomyces sp. NPDC048611 TaxID=3155635 RepID=UPI00341DD850
MTAPVQVGLPQTSGGPTPTLTQHEREVLQLIASGYSHEEIAEMLVMTRKGITPTVNRAMRKLGARNAPHAVLLACQAGILDGRRRRHGDHAGYAAHIYHREEPCAACVVGEREYRSRQRTIRKRVTSNTA